MDKIIDYLKHLDLSDAEARLYLTLLQTGPTSVRDLAQTVDIKRTTAYFYIDQLVEKGLIMKLVRGSKKLIAACEPENLQVLVEEKLKKANEVQNEFPTILKALTTSLPKENGAGEAEIKFYKGRNGVKKIYEEALQATELRSYVNLETLRNAFPENEGLFLNALHENKDIKIFEIFEYSSTTKTELIKNLKEKNNEKFLYKFLPKEIKLSAVDILIYNNKVAIISIHQQITGVIFQNSEYFTNSKELFDLVWKILP